MSNASSRNSHKLMGGKNPDHDDKYIKAHGQAGKEWLAWDEPDATYEHLRKGANFFCTEWRSQFIACHTGSDENPSGGARMSADFFNIAGIFKTNTDLFQRSVQGIPP